MAHRNLVCFSPISILMRILEVKIYVDEICGRPGLANVFYGFSKDERDIEQSIHSLTYAMHVDINLPAWCWCRLCVMMVVRMLGLQRCMKRRWNWRKFFQKVASSAIHLIPYSVRFVGSHDRISACDVIDLDMMHAVCVGEIGDKPDLSLPPLSLYTFSGSVNLLRFFLPSFI